MIKKSDLQLSIRGLSNYFNETHIAIYKRIANVKELIGLYSANTKDALEKMHERYEMLESQHAKTAELLQKTEAKLNQLIGRFESDQYARNYEPKFKPGDEVLVFDDVEAQIVRPRIHVEQKGDNFAIWWEYEVIVYGNENRTDVYREDLIWHKPVCVNTAKKKSKKSKSK